MARRRRVIERLLLGAVALEIVLLAAFGVALTVGERSRLGFIALYVPRQPVLAAAVCAAAAAAIARKRKLAAFQVGVMLVVLVPVMGLRVGVAKASAHPIRIASYNVFFGKLGRGQVLDEIAAKAADIVVIQAGWGSLGKRLRERFPDRTVHQDGELLVVSRFPLRSVDVPPPAPDGTPAMYVGYLFETPRGPLRVYNAHPFSPRYALRDARRVDANLAQRETQVAAVVAAARRSGPPFLIAGDTNLPVMSTIERHHFAGLRDAFEEVGLGFGYTFPARLPWMRIDRVLAGDGIRFVDVSVAPRGASDHRALVVEFELAHEP